eukprot:653579-Alexandrium_andersonii.AAC.1
MAFRGWWTGQGRGKPAGRGKANPVAVCDGRTNSISGEGGGAKHGPIGGQTTEVNRNSAAITDRARRRAVFLTAE